MGTPDTELPLDASRWAVSCSLFEKAIELDAPDRAPFLAEATCDLDVRRLVERMLDADARSPNVIDLMEAALDSIRTIDLNVPPTTSEP